MNFRTVIGLEIHVQLKTKSKMFCGCDNKADEAKPNTLVCPVCLGLPGVLPVANRQAIEWTIKTGLALGSDIAEFSKFDRKHYFYPDLPKGYQISQYDAPFCVNGEIDIEGHKIRITRIHLEEDAGKLIHSGDDSLVDLNRAGTPLMEIVTEPDIQSPAEAKIFMQELRSILRYLDVSDADMEKGHLRCDANISIEVDGKEGVPAEIKNLNSFRMVERALAFEESRQKEDLEAGKKIIKETRGWDDKRGFTFPQRNKEIAQDYRYFPEPDLPPFTLSKVFDIDKIKKEIPELPAQKRQRYQEMGIKISDAEILAVDKEMAEYFEGVAKASNATLAANWIINELKMDGILIVSPENLGELLQLIEKGEISGKIAKDVLSEMIETGKTAPEIIETSGLKQIGDEGEIGKIIDKVIAENPKPVSDIKAGKQEALGFLVGLVMRESKGSANPQLVNRLLKERIK